MDWSETDPIIHEIIVLIQEGYQDTDGTLLAFACEWGELNIVDALFESKQSIDLEKKHSGDTLLTLAIRHDHSRLARRLIEKGVSTDKAFEVAVVWHEVYIVTLLVERGHYAAKFFYNDFWYKFVAVFEAKVINTYVAACTKNWDALDKLDVNMINDDGQNALHYIAGDRGGHYVDVIYYLFQRGIKVNLKDNHGKTPFSMAYRNMRHMKCLLWLGARYDNMCVRTIRPVIVFIQIIALGLPSCTKKRIKQEDNVWTDFLIKHVVYDPSILRIVDSFFSKSTVWNR
jgi:hypothetical protein